ncbi:MAG: nucleoid-associated protein [Muribaculaceae bacterium]|nr:nucleoid-associated protein [Muribaculaceae bacterium]
MNAPDLKILKIIVHSVGNKFQDEELKLSESPFIPSYAISLILSKYFITSFKQDDQIYHFVNDVDLRFNELNGIATCIFENENTFIEQSKKIAHHLYNESNHPKIKSGELYIVLFEEDTIDAPSRLVLGIFKSENKETYLRVYPEGNNLKIAHDNGININRLDKGCLIYNLDKESGYQVLIVDNCSKSKLEEAKYWKERFLQIKPRNTNYLQTENLMNLCKQFVSEISDDSQGKQLKGNLFNHVIEELKSDKLTLSEFIPNTFDRYGLTEEFKNFLSSKEHSLGIEIAESFSPSKTAVTKGIRTQKITTIRLDDNFDIKMHSDKGLLERGYDKNRGLFYYKLFFKEEK